jgi:Flp pilus assembly protein TadD
MLRVLLAAGVMIVITFITAACIGENTMSQSPYQFRPQEVGKAVDLIEEMRTEGLNKSKLAREGLKTLLREITSPEEKAEIYARYQRGDLDEETTRVILGDALDTMEADAEAVHIAIEDDTSDLVQ